MQVRIICTNIKEVEYVKELVNYGSFDPESIQNTIDKHSEVSIFVDSLIGSIQYCSEKCENCVSDCAGEFKVMYAQNMMRKAKLSRIL